VRLRKGRVSIGQAGGLGGESKGVRARAPWPVSPGSTYRIVVDVYPDGRVRASLPDFPDLPSVEHLFEAGVFGSLGFQASRARSLVDNVVIWGDRVLR
jgi:hypothetical protein